MNGAPDWSNREELPMVDNVKEAVEKLLINTFVDLMNIGRINGVTGKRMVEILPLALVRALRQQGLTQQRIMAETGYTLKTIRKMLAGVHLPVDHTDYIGQIVGDWASDVAFPGCLPLNGSGFPTFRDFCDRYGREFTPSGLLEVLLDRDLAKVEDNKIYLLERSVTPSTTLELVETAAGSIQALIGTLTHNLAQEKPAFMERRIRSRRIPRERIQILRQELRKLMENLRMDAIKLIDSAEEREKDGVTDLGAVGIGMYWYEEND